MKYHAKTVRKKETFFLPDANSKFSTPYVNSQLDYFVNDEKIPGLSPKRCSSRLHEEVIGIVRTIIVVGLMTVYLCLENVHTLTILHYKSGTITAIVASHLTQSGIIHPLSGIARILFGLYITRKKNNMFH